MKIIDKNTCIKEKTAITIGKFDGFHKGHTLLINEVTADNDLASLIYMIIPNDLSSRINTKEESIDILNEMGADYAYFFELSKDIASMSKEDFIKMLIDKYNMHKLVVGTDFHFGYKAEGDVEYLKSAAQEFGFKLSIIEDTKYKGEKISSTRIKNELEKGNIEDCNNMLGRYFSFEGTVEHGKELGRTISFPTANISAEKMHPKYGVYASIVEYNGCKYLGISNVGVRPTVENSGKTNIETFIFDFDKDIYGEHIKVDLVSFVRSECRFASLKELTDMIDDNCKTVLKFFKENGLQNN